MPKAVLLLRERVVLSRRDFVELVVWKVPTPLAGSAHPYKYRVAYVAEGRCVLRYDNEQGKGDHRHTGDREDRYDFRSASNLLDDFWADLNKERGP